MRQEHLWAMPKPTGAEVEKVRCLRPTLISSDPASSASWEESPGDVGKEWAARAQPPPKPFKEPDATVTEQFPIVSACL